MVSRPLIMHNSNILLSITQKTLFGSWRFGQFFIFVRMSRFLTSVPEIDYTYWEIYIYKKKTVKHQKLKIKNKFKVENKQNESSSTKSRLQKMKPTKKKKSKQIFVFLNLQKSQESRKFATFQNFKISKISL